MKYVPLIWAGLWRKPVWTVFTFLSMVVTFAVVRRHARRHGGHRRHHQSDE